MWTINATMQKKNIQKLVIKIFLQKVTESRDYRSYKKYGMKHNLWVVNSRSCDMMYQMIAQTHKNAIDM